MQRGQAQGVAGAITTGQLTAVEARKKMLLRTTHHFHTHAEILTTILVPYKCLEAKSYLADRNNPKPKRNANNHGDANQIAQAEAIKFAAR